MWSVPVTTLDATIATSQPYHRLDDPMTTLRRHSAVLTALQRCIASFSGVSIDVQMGDRFMLHFNALQRTPKHVLAAISVVSNVCKNWKKRFTTANELLSSSNHRQLHSSISVLHPALRIVVSLDL
ncbi:GPI-anchored surface protein, putative [Bodo saltans]|uniref:GPI-anchored surface protein, putative n=1 Tax=Bodo saltans TaxID=75058 RepID=A0A0S4JJB3_BODSA|nr:GPI-anchored surface protein, putative [Bodo saltans]|eukprot:CUG90272.1 GPI-anchored surface protein, putative [Bodo saltans]